MICVNKNIIPFFSVIVTTYNRSKLLDRALDSLLGQTFDDWECLIVDDGSSDNTFNKAIKYCKEDPRFRYMFHSHRRQSSSKNAGILAANGIFVTFLDSDDEYKPEHLDSRHQILRQYNDVDFLHGGVQIVGNKYVPDLNNPSKLIHLNDCIIGGTFFIKRNIAIEIGGFPDKDYGDDTMFFEKAENYNCLIAKIQIPTYIYYRDTEDSLCNSILKSK